MPCFLDTPYRLENVAESDGAEDGPAEVHLGGGQRQHGGAHQRAPRAYSQTNRQETFSSPLSGRRFRRKKFFCKNNIHSSNIIITTGFLDTQLKDYNF